MGTVGGRSSIAPNGRCGGVTVHDPRRPTLAGVPIPGTTESIPSPVCYRTATRSAVRAAISTHRIICIRKI